MQYVKWAAAFFLCLECSAGQNALAADSQPVLALPNGAMVFGETPEGRLVLSRLTAEAQGNAHEWITDGIDVPLWTVVVLDGNRQKHTITALDAEARQVDMSDADVRFAWRNLSPGAVDVEIAMSVRGDDVVGDLSVEVNEEGFTLWDATFPELGPLSLSQQVYSITTNGWGVLHRDLMNQSLNDRVYPSSARAMPFVGVSDGETGVYVGIEKNPGYPVRLFVGRRENEQAVTLGLRHEVEDMGVARRYRMPYTVVISPFRGGWYEAARIYRRTAMSSSWGGVPPLAERTDLPRWLVNTDLWYQGSCHDEATANEVLQFARFFGVPTSAHIYNWHQIPFDDRYPEYFPAKPGFKDAVAKVQGAGIPIMPYINGRLWDPATESWEKLNAASAAALDENKQRYEEVYGSSVPLSPMCPATELWQRTVTDLVNRLHTEIGVQSVYIDQISAAAAKRCFAGNHGHPIGGGTSWIQGYRDLLREARSVLPQTTALTTEENADPWNDRLDAFLMVNTRPGNGEIVPLYPAVYSGRVVYFGFQYFGGEDFTQRYPLRLKFAKTFLYGSQMGWIGSGILAPGSEPEAEFLRRLCERRHAHRDALQFGEMLAPVALGAVNPVRWEEPSDNGPVARTHPAVMATMWRTHGGVYKLILANVSDDVQNTEVFLSPQHLPADRRESGSPRLIGDGADVGLEPAGTGVLMGRVSVPGRETAVLIYEDE